MECHNSHVKVLNILGLMYTSKILDETVELFLRLAILNHSEVKHVAMRQKCKGLSNYMFVLQTKVFEF